MGRETLRSLWDMNKPHLRISGLSYEAVLKWQRIIAKHPYAILCKQPTRFVVYSNPTDDPDVLGLGSSACEAIVGKQLPKF